MFRACFYVHMRVKSKIIAPKTNTYESFAWRSSAACISLDIDPNGEEIFMEYTGRVSEAKEVCASCIVQQECKMFGLTEVGLELHMVVGGLTREERLRQAQQQSIAA